MHFLGRPMKILDNHVQATLKLAARHQGGPGARKPDLVLWPENSSDLDPFQYPQAYDKITEAVQAVGVPVLVGALVDGPDAGPRRRTRASSGTRTTGPGAPTPSSTRCPSASTCPSARS